MSAAAQAFDSIGKYYDLLYQDKPYAQEADYVHALLQRLGQPGREVLELGSGTGRHARLLAARGLDILGVELNPTMLARSEPAPGFRSVQGDARSYDAGRPFDVVLSLFHVLSYQTTDADLDAVFANAARHLRPGGHFVFDCWFSPAVGHQGAIVRVKRMADAHYAVTRIAEPVLHPSRNVVDVHFTVFLRDLQSGHISHFSELHPMRHFCVPELDRVARAYGLERRLTEEFVTTRAPGPDTWGVCFAYQKVAQ